MSIELFNLLVLLGLIPVGVFSAWGVLRGIDKLNGVRFTKDVMPIITEDARATALYYGLRFASVCVFIAYLCGRFV